MASAENRCMVFCALETYLCPHTVLLKRGAAHTMRQLGPGSGEGQYTGTKSNARHDMIGANRCYACRPVHGAGSRAGRCDNRAFLVQ
jgi:hypothetical protein